MRDTAISVRGLYKSYGDIQAVNGVTLDVHVGEVFALLGPNGAGKTTLVEMLEGHRTPTSGQVSVLGFDPGQHKGALKQRVGIVLQETGVEEYLTVEEIINLFRGYYPHPRPVPELLHMTGLVKESGTRVRRLSGGQRRRLDVALGLAGDPDLLFLDEPTTGFDPSSRRTAWGMIKNLRSLGKTIFLTTHYMEEAEFLADRVGVMAKGQIVYQGYLSDLMGNDSWSVITFNVTQFEVALPASLLNIATMNEDVVTIQTENPTQVLHEITSWALHNKCKLQNLKVSHTSLEDIFLSLTNHKGGTAKHL